MDHLRTIVTFAIEQLKFVCERELAVADMYGLHLLAGRSDRGKTQSMADSRAMKSVGSAASTAQVSSSKFPCRQGETP